MWSLWEVSKINAQRKALQFNAMCNRYTGAMWLFDKNLKPSFGYIWEEGSSSVICVDETLLGGDEF